MKSLKRSSQKWQGIHADIERLYLQCITCSQNFNILDIYVYNCEIFLYNSCVRHKIDSDEPLYKQIRFI